MDVRAWVRANKLEQAKGIYYFCVRGDITSTYTIKAREFEIDSSNSILEDGYSEMFFMFPGGLQSHLYHVPKLEYPGEDIKIEVDLTVKTGD